MFSVLDCYAIHKTWNENNEQCVKENNYFVNDVKIITAGKTNNNVSNIKKEIPSLW